MAECLLEDCNLNTYEHEDKCILHCEKHEYSQDFHKIGFLNSFYRELMYLIASLLESNEVGTKEHILEYLEDETASNTTTTINFNNIRIMIVLNEIYFPQSKDIDSFEYTRLLRKLERIYFNYCKFSISYLDLHNTECFFHDCKFQNALLLYNFYILENESNVLFQKCEFNDGVVSFGDGRKMTIDNSLFCDCSFNKLTFEDTTFKQPIFKNSKGFTGEIKEFSMSNSIVEDRFILNYHAVESLSLVDTIFHEKVELKKARNIVDCSISNCNFKGLVDCYTSNFDNLFIYKSIFEEYVGFEYCRFGTSYEKCENCSTKFEYVTFLNFINMRNTNFISGLDFSSANLKEYPNFLGAKINPLNTNKETFRIIKHSFDKIGNTSEANRYFSCEMNKEMSETLFLRSPAKKTMLFLNRLLSNFGQWYFLPLMWLLILIPFHEWVVSSHSFDNLDTLNHIVKNILPVKHFLNKDMEFISLLFYIAYSGLIYHFIISVKRITKR